MRIATPSMRAASIGEGKAASGRRLDEADCHGADHRRSAVVVLAGSVDRLGMKRSTFPSALPRSRRYSEVIFFPNMTLNFPNMTSSR
jgi:hypothetical protein